MSRFSEKGYFVKENAAIYMTRNMDRTAKWFKEVMGWYSNIVERDSAGCGQYGVVFDILPEVETTHLAPFTGFQMFAGEPMGGEISFMQVKGIDNLYKYVTGKDWNDITPVEVQPWGGKVCRVTTVDGYAIRIFE